MGSASSRAVRKLPKEKPTWAGSRAPVPATTGLERSRSERPSAFKSRHEVEMDAKDPHFMEKLSQLGPVQVDHPMQTTTRIARLADTRSMYQSRIRSEVEAAGLQSTKNRLLASSLMELLEARKSTTNGAGLEALAERYRIDVAKLEQLGQFVNTPTTDDGRVLRTRDKYGEETLTIMARWVDPTYVRA